MQSVLGIDVSKDKLDVILRSGEKKQHQVISNDLKGYQYLERWLLNNSVGQVHVCLEATGQYGEPIAEYLYAHGYLVSVVNQHGSNGMVKANYTAIRRTKRMQI